MPYEESDAYREEYPNTGTFLTPLVPMIVNDSRVCFCKPASLHTGRRTQDNLGGRPTREQGPRGGYRERKGLVWPKHTSSNSLRGPRLLVHLAGGLPIEPASLFSLSCSIRKLVPKAEPPLFGHRPAGLPGQSNWPRGKRSGPERAVNPTPLAASFARDDTGGLCDFFNSSTVPFLPSFLFLSTLYHGREG